jgi:hypothetical protein
MPPSHVNSVGGVPIRLSDERWRHIVEHHDDLAGHYHDVLETVAAPDAVYEGSAEELVAVRRYERRYPVVPYRELSEEDGFVITAFFTTRVRQIERRRLVWRRA